MSPKLRATGTVFGSWLGLSLASRPFRRMGLSGKSTGHFLMTYMTKTGFFRFQSKRHPAKGHWPLFPPTGLQQKRRNMKTFGRSQPRINTLLGCLIEGSQFNSNSNSCMVHLHPQIQILGLIKQWKTPAMPLCKIFQL